MGLHNEAQDERSAVLGELVIFRQILPFSLRRVKPMRGHFWPVDPPREFNKHKAIVVAGMGGMGKTSLSREAAAWWLRSGRFERAVFCSFELVQSVERAVQILGKAFEGLEFNQRSTEEQRARAIELFHQHRVLLVWDNFESTLPHFQNEGEQESQSHAPGNFSAEERSHLRAFFRELTQGKPDGRLLVTCRPVETGLPRIKKFPLEGLAVHDSLHLVNRLPPPLDRQTFANLHRQLIASGGKLTSKVVCQPGRIRLPVVRLLFRAVILGRWLRRWTTV